MLRSGAGVMIEVRAGVTVKAEAVAGLEADLKRALQDLETISVPRRRPAKGLPGPSGG